MKRVTRGISVLAAMAMVFYAHGVKAEGSSDPYSQSINIVDRVKDGPHMITDQLEYVAAASFMTLHIAYNVFVHKKLSKAAQLGDLHPDRILAEERMSSESTKLCANHLRANECNVFLWASMDPIPPGDFSFVKAGLQSANGIFKWNKGGRSVFTWRNEGEILRSRAQSKVEPFKAVSDDEVYHREVRASNRFLDGAKMIGEDLEFISAESVVHMRVLYHVYVHPRLLRNMRAPKLSSEQLTAEKKIVEESQKLCNKHKRTDECVILLWGALGDIPLDAKQVRYKDFMGRAQGVYIAARGRRASFEWHEGN